MTSPWSGSPHATFGSCQGRLQRSLDRFFVIWSSFKRFVSMLVSLLVRVCPDSGVYHDIGMACELDWIILPLKEVQVFLGATRVARWTV